MSIESITERIRKEAEAYAAERRAQAEAVRKETLDDARREGEVLRDRLTQEAARDAETLKARRQSVADLDARKMALAAKQEIIEESFAAAKAQLLDLPPEAYSTWIREQLASFGNEGGEVLLNNRDRERYGAQLEKELAGTSLRLSAETAEIEGGCILRRGNVSYNASVEKLLNNVRAELTAEIAGLLFR